ncbi:MAG: VWA domain-containing protein [Desulfovibrio sp.]|nr:VWA domain-containing protein [Desulfovibrio sp.]
MRYLLMLLLLLCPLLGSVQGADCAPLLQDGKKTLFQRVVSHPGAQLYADASESSEVVNRALKTFTVLYVFERKDGWLNVGVDTHRPQGWLKEELSTRWDQSLTLLFAPRTGRDPVVFYSSFDALRSVCEATDMDRQVREIMEKAKAKQEDARIVAAEPADSAVSSERFYLMPILETQEPFDGVKFLKVASINPGKAGKPKADGDGGGARKEGKDGAPKTGIAIVIDTSISMKPYIDQSLKVVKTIYDRIEKEGLSDNVGFAVVAFRSSTAATPKLGYTTEIVSDFVTAKNRAKLETSLAKVEEAKASSHDFNEDSLAGVYQAIESLSWEDYDSRIVMLVSDAGPLRQEDRYASVRMGPAELDDFAKQKGIWIVALHVKSPSGKKNHQYAEEAYRALSKTADGRSNYQAINAPNPKTGAKYFEAVARSIAGAMVSMVKSTASGKLMTIPERHDKPQPAPEEASQASAEDMATRLGYAMQLDFLGKRQNTEAPEVVSSWIPDMDLAHLAHSEPVPAVEVAVLLTKNQLSDLRDQISAIIDSAERTKKTDSADFFKGILSASAKMARDPNMPTEGKTLAELGVLGEFLEGLPYRSEVMLLKEDDWYRKSVGEQTAFINRLKSKIARYEEYDRDRANWESFGMSSAGDWVYRVPLDMLP